MIKAIIFDVDGVLDPNYELHYESSKKKTTGITREEHRKLFEGNIHVERAKLADRDTGFNMVHHINNSQFGKDMPPGTKEVLKALSQKYIVGVITSGLENGVHNYLKHNDCAEYVSFIYGYETNTLKEEKFKLALSKNNLLNSECLYVTDTLGDIKDATVVGIRCIAFTGGYHERERLALGSPIAIIDDLSEIDSIVKNLKD
jgi:HAD superfamily hydrolase (TIGR01549 family)